MADPHSSTNSNLTELAAVEPEGGSKQPRPSHQGLPANNPGRISKPTTGQAKWRSIAFLGFAILLTLAVGAGPVLVRSMTLVELYALHETPSIHLKWAVAPLRCERWTGSRLEWLPNRARRYPRSIHADRPSEELARRLASCFSLCNRCEIVEWRGSISSSITNRLGQLTSLTEMKLMEVDNLDAVLQKSGKLTELRCLTISRCQLEKHTQESLANLDQLNILILSDTPIAETDLRQLQQDLPETRIVLID